jgi:homoserine kinase
VQGKEADRVSCGPDNLLYQSFLKVYEVLQQPPPPVGIEIELNVPLARGLGSSATAIVGGLVGANALAGSPFKSSEILQWAIELEGHPDNVVPAFLGGCRLAAATGETDEAQKPKLSWQICEIPWHPDILAILAVPDFELSTQAARQVLPPTYSRGDAVFNVAHLGLLVRALETGNGDWLKVALVDRIHQPYRQSLIPGYHAVQEAAMAAGAYGLVISGAGPTLLTLTAQAQASAIERAIESAWTAQGIGVEVKRLAIDPLGTTVS